MKKKDGPSIIPQSKPTQCYFCGKRDGLEKHHCLHGAFKKLAVQDGLWVWICRKCHEANKDSVHLDPDHIKDHYLQRLAQETLIKQYVRQGYPADVARDMFLKRYGRFFD